MLNLSWEIKKFLLLKLYYKKSSYIAGISYIANVCEEIDNTRVIRYSENESMNLIISSYAAKAEEKKIHSEINVSTVDFGKFMVPGLPCIKRTRI